MTEREARSTLKCTEAHDCGQPYVHFCPKCRRSVKSEKITVSAQVNGKKGGRPRKTEPKAKP